MRSLLGRRLWAMAGGTVVLVILAGATAKPGGLARPAAALEAAIGPVERATTAIWQAGTVLTQGVTGLWTLDAQNARLRAEVRQYRSALTRQAALQAQVQQLTGMVQLQGAARQAGLGTGIPALVIARSPSGWFQSVVIDRGSANGVQAGMVALTGSGLVGVVEPGVGRTTAQVMLLTNPDFGVGVSVDQNAGIEGVASGQLGTTALTATFFSPTADVQVGDTLVTSGLTTPGVGGGFPAGLPVGRVVEVTSGDSGLARQAVVQPVAQLQSLRDILLLPAASSG